MVHRCLITIQLPDCMSKCLLYITYLKMQQAEEVRQNLEPCEGIPGQEGNWILLWPILPTVSTFARCRPQRPTRRPSSCRQVVRPTQIWNSNTKLIKLSKYSQLSICILFGSNKKCLTSSKFYINTTTLSTLSFKNEKNKKKWASQLEQLYFQVVQPDTEQ